MSKKSPKKGANKEKHIYYDDKCSKLEIALTYNGKSETLSIDNKQNISSIKEKVYILFYPIQGKFQLLYKNKDISPFEDIPLYKYFKNLMKVSIIIQPISSTTIQSLLSANANNSFNNSIQDITAIEKNDASLGNANQNQLNNSQSPTVGKDRMLCNDCHNKLIGYFCRNCNSFICKTCSEKYSSPHRSHSTVVINVSQIEKSAKNYKDMVSKECFNSGKKFDEFNRNNNALTINNNEMNNNVNEVNNIINNENGNENNENENEKKEKRDIDGWLNDMNTKIEDLNQVFTKNDEVNINTNFTLQDEENNYELLLKKIQKINAEKNTKDLETIFNEMNEIDNNIKLMDSNLEQCINNSENNKTNNKVLKDLNKNLDNIINKLVKSIDFSEKTNENFINNF